MFVFSEPSETLQKQLSEQWEGGPWLHTSHTSFYNLHNHGISLDRSIILVSIVVFRFFQFGNGNGYESIVALFSRIEFQFYISEFIILHAMENGKNQFITKFGCLHLLARHVLKLEVEVKHWGRKINHWKHNKWIELEKLK